MLVEGLTDDSWGVVSDLIRKYIAMLVKEINIEWKFRVLSPLADEVRLKQNLREINELLLEW